MSDLMHILRRTARRHLTQRAVRFTGTGLFAALGAGCVLLLAERATGLPLPSITFVIIAAGGILVGLVFAFTRQPDRHALAILLDQSFDLKDRLGTAEALTDYTPRWGRARHDADFAELVRHDADRVAGSLDVRPATPIHLTRNWGAAIILVPILWLGDLYLPVAPWVDQGPDPALLAQRRAELQQQRTELAASIEETIGDLAGDETLDEATRQELQLLDELAGQLSREDSPVDPRRARDETAARMDDVANRLAEQAQRDAAAADELARRFSGLPPVDSPKEESSPLSDEFLDAVKRGEFDKAAALLDEMLDDQEGMTETQRQGMAEQLRNLSQQITRSAERPGPAAAERREQMEQVLRDQGLDQQAIDDLLNSDDETSQNTQEDLQQRGVDDQIARDLTRDIEQLRDQRRLDEQVDRDAKDVADALDKAADEIEQPPPAGNPAQDDRTSPPAPTREGESQEPPDEAQPPQPPPPGRPDDAQPRPGDEQRTQRGDQQQTQQGDQRQSPQQNRQQQTNQEGQQQPPRGGEKPPQQPGQQPQTTDQPQTAEQRESQGQGEHKVGEEKTVPDHKPGQQPQQTGKPPQSQQAEGAENTPGEPTPPQQQPGEQIQPPAGQRPGQQQIPDPRTIPDGPQPPQIKPGGQERLEDSPDGAHQLIGPQQDESERQGVGESEDQANRSPSDVLRELERRRRDAQRQRDAAERIGEAARELGDNMTEEQRQRWTRRPPEPDDRRPPLDSGLGAGDQPGELIVDEPKQYDTEGTEDVELGGDEGGGRTIAEWLSDEPPAGEGQPASQSDRAQQIDRAQRIAERAVNDSAVPGRYHRLIRQYFDRLGGTLEQAASKTSSSRKTSEKKDGPAASDPPAESSSEDRKQP